MENMELLIAKLNELYQRPDEHEDGYWYEGQEDELVDEIAGMAMTLLHVNENGRFYRNYDNVKIIEDAGFLNYPGEHDSFGWLTGCLQKKGDMRTLVYG